MKPVFDFQILGIFVDHPEYEEGGQIYEAKIELTNGTQTAFLRAFRDFCTKYVPLNHLNDFDGERHIIFLLKKTLNVNSIFSII